MTAQPVPIETDLHIDVRLLAELVNSLDSDVRWLKYDFDENGPEALNETLEADLIAWALIEEARRNLAILSRDLEKVCAKSMVDKTQVTPAGTFEKHRKKDRTQWDKDDLLRAVLDTRRFDPDGTMVDETPLDKVLTCWNLPSPRLTALRDRGLDPDEFCRSEDAGWSLRLST